MHKFKVGDKLVRDGKIDYQRVPYHKLLIIEIEQRNERTVYKINTDSDTLLLYSDTVDVLYNLIFNYNKLWNDLNENHI